jgi:hypothetical protein
MTMELQLSTVPMFTPAEAWTVLFCVIWPFLAMKFIAKHGRTSAPISAMIVAIAAVEAVTWYELARLVTLLPLPPTFVSDGPSPAWVLPWSAFWIACIAWIRRHRPVPDAMVMTLSALLLAGAIAARVFEANLEPRYFQFYAARTAAAALLTVAAAALVWLVRTHRQRAS